MLKVGVDDADPRSVRDSHSRKHGTAEATSPLGRHTVNDLHVAATIGSSDSDRVDRLVAAVVDEHDLRRDLLECAPEAPDQRTDVSRLVLGWNDDRKQRSEPCLLPTQRRWLGLNTRAVGLTRNAKTSLLYGSHRLPLSVSLHDPGAAAPVRCKRRRASRVARAGEEALGEVETSERTARRGSPARQEARPPQAEPRRGPRIPAKNRSTIRLTRRGRRATGAGVATETRAPRSPFSRSSHQHGRRRRLGRAARGRSSQTVARRPRRPRDRATASSRRDWRPRRTPPMSGSTGPVLAPWVPVPQRPPACPWVQKSEPRLPRAGCRRMVRMVLSRPARHRPRARAFRPAPVGWAPEKTAWNPPASPEHPRLTTTAAACPPLAWANRGSRCQNRVTRSRGSLPRAAPDQLPQQELQAWETPRSAGPPPTKRTRLSRPEQDRRAARSFRPFPLRPPDSLSRRELLTRAVGCYVRPLPMRPPDPMAWKERSDLPPRAARRPGSRSPGRRPSAVEPVPQWSSPERRPLQRTPTRQVRMRGALRTVARAERGDEASTAPAR